MELDDSFTKQEPMYLEMSDVDNGKITTVRWVPRFKIREYHLDECTQSACNLRGEHQCVHFGQFLYDVITNKPGYKFVCIYWWFLEIEIGLNFQEPP